LEAAQPVKKFEIVAHEDPVVRFRQEILDSGLAAPNHLNADGGLHRFATDIDKRGEESGWYVLQLNGIPSGAFSCWRSEGPDYQTWCAKEHQEMSSAEWQTHTVRMEVARQKRQIAEAQRSQGSLPETVEKR